MRLGVDVLELDLALSRDGVLVVSHDPEINPARCAGGERLPSRSLKDLTCAEIQTLDCGSARNPGFPAQVPQPGERMPTLEQVLNLVAAEPRVGINAEIKTFPKEPARTRPPEDFARVLVSLLRARGLSRRVTIQSFDARALLAVRRLLPGARLSALAESRADFEPMLGSTGARTLSPRHTELQLRDVERLHARGLRVVPWTVNEGARMQELAGWGVDGLITDYPDRLLALLGRGPRPR
jgi:glycerophosphoryl diester phosphodiesterase